jgi:hypothetical protein
MDSSAVDRRERYESAISLIQAWASKDEAYDEAVGRELDKMFAESDRGSNDDVDLPGPA